MSCGSPHSTPCTEVLDALSQFIDSELETATAEEIRRHLDECGPCLKEEEVERWLRAKVASCCADEPVPAEVRTRVVERFSVMVRSVSLTSNTGEVRSQAVYSETTITSAVDPQAGAR